MPRSHAYPSQTTTAWSQWSSDLSGLVQITLNALSDIPEPISGAIITAIKTIWDEVQQSSQNKNQMRYLCGRICHILSSLKVPKSYDDDALKASVSLLVHHLESVLGFMRVEAKKNFLRSMLQADDLKLKMEEYERLIVTACMAFQNAALFSANQKLNELFNLVNNQQSEADRRDLQTQAYLRDISDRVAAMQTASNYPIFLDMLLDTVNADARQMRVAMEIVLQRDGSRLKAEEREFLRSGIDRLNVGEGYDVKIEQWSVTGYEVERGYLLGGDRTSIVRMAKWRREVVLMVEMKNREAVERSVVRWKDLRNERISTFMAASATDDPPFILIPFPGTPVLEFVRAVDLPLPLFIASDIAQGLEYLHGLDPPVVHGGIRPANIVVDQSGYARLMLTGLKNTDLAYPVEDYDNLTREWTAPELRFDQTYTSQAEPTPASDMYAYGATVTCFFDVAMALGRARPEGKKLAFDAIQNWNSADPQARPTAGSVAAALSPHVQRQEKVMFVPQPMDEEQAAGKDHWRMVRTASRKLVRATNSKDDAYLCTPPMDGKGDKPLRRLCFEVKCHDQGAEATSASPRDGTYCWIEIAILRGEGGEEHEVNIAKAHPKFYRGHMVKENRTEVVRCPFADSTLRTHRVTFDESHPIVQLVQKGDRIQLHPKALFPGWVCSLYEAEVQVISEY